MIIQLMPYRSRSCLALSDVMGTGWFAADAANIKRGTTVAVVGDGAVGLLGVLSAKQMGADRIIAMSRHAPQQTLAREFGATDIVTERGDEGEVTFDPVEGQINDRIHDAYRAKYRGSPYLSPMISARARSATIKVVPGDQTLIAVLQARTAVRMGCWLVR